MKDYAYCVLLLILRVLKRTVTVEDYMCIWSSESLLILYLIL